MAKDIISSIHNDPEGWIIAGIIFLANVKQNFTLLGKHFFTLYGKQFFT